MGKTIFIPITEEMLVLHPIRTIHHDLRSDNEKIERFIKEICQYVYVNGVMTNNYWKVKGYSVTSNSDGTVVLVSYKQNVDTDKFPQTENIEQELNSSPLPEALQV